MTAPVLADRLEVHHYDDRITTYPEPVTYWLWPGGVTVWDADGNVELGRHDDVLRTAAAKDAA